MSVLGSASSVELLDDDIPTSIKLVASVEIEGSESDASAVDCEDGPATI